MKQQFEYFIKYIPAITLICYIFGFVIFNSFLLINGIVDNDIISIRYLAAGILFMLYIAACIGPSFVPIRKYKFAKSTLISLLLGVFFHFIIMSWSSYPKRTDLLLFSCVLIIGYNFYYSKFKMSILKMIRCQGSFIFGSAFILLLTLSLTFGMNYFQNISVKFGGAHQYKKILYLKAKNDNLLKTNGILQSDTVNVIYENQNYIYIKEGTTTKCIRKDVIAGDVLVF